MSIISMPHTRVYDIIAENIRDLKELSDEDFLAKFRAYIDTYRYILKQEDLLSYRDSIKGQVWAQ